VACHPLEENVKSLGARVFVFFMFATSMFALAFSFAARDIFSFLQVNNIEVLGDSFRLSSLVGVSFAILLGLFFGIFYPKSRHYVEQCVAEFDKVAWPSLPETKKATLTVVMVSFIASCILGVFDTAFSWLTNHNLFMW